MTNLEDKLLDEMLSFLGGEVEETLIKEYFSKDLKDYISYFRTICNIRFPNQGDRVHEIGLVVDEMLDNSYCYSMDFGYKEGYCRAASYLAKNGIVVVVEDDGPGFGHEEHIRGVQQGPNFTKRQLLGPENIGDALDFKQLAPEGFGIRRLLAFSTHYAYNDVGNKIYMHFAIP